MQNVGLAPRVSSTSGLFDSKEVTMVAYVKSGGNRYSSERSSTMWNGYGMDRLMEWKWYGVDTGSMVCSKFEVDALGGGTAAQQPR